MMALIVQKYGGTSVASVERIKSVSEHIKKTKEKENDVVVVISALAGETDKLVDLARSLSSHPSQREMDLLLSSGERISSALIAIRLNEMGCRAIALTGRQSGIVTNNTHLKARILHIDKDVILNYLKDGYVVVITGFQGISEKGEVTTLGRGGSDTSAVAIAACIGANICEIYTDVDGIFTADPRIVKDARKINRISYDEIMELASLGTKVLQIRAVELGKKYKVPMKVLSSFTYEPGTLVSDGGEMEEVVVSGVAYDKNQARLTITKVPDRKGIAAQVFETIASKNIVVDMIVQNVSEEGFTDISFTVPKDDAEDACEITNKISKEIRAGQVTLNKDVSKVSIVGVGMRSYWGIAAQMFRTLAKEGINIRMISTSEIKISCIIDEKYTELAVRALHRNFNLSEK
jgi:aspartate kinase